MIHRHKYKLFGIYYETHSGMVHSYTVIVYEVYKCTRCDKYKRKKKSTMDFTFISSVNDYIEKLKKLGYKEYIELYKDKLMRGE